MTNLFSYVEKYGDKTFKEKKFNDVDNLVFSLLSYLDFSNTQINRGKSTLKSIGNEYLSKNEYRKIRQLGIAQKDAYKLLEIVIHKKRYKNILLLHYVYNTSKDIQFSAITFKISRKLKYICFEGTNELVSGWKEDGQLACFFPIPSQKEAINYVNKNVKLLGSKVIIGGHSKGGNLALVSSMFMKKYKKFKVEKVYSNDGPGLRKKEFESKEYKNIKRKYIHFVPHCSVVGVLLRNDCYHVIKSSKNNIFSHSLSTWIVEDDKLVPSELAEKSKRLERSLISWLEMHNDQERKEIIDALFKVLEDADIEVLLNVRKIRNMIKVIRNLKNIDLQTKELAIDFIAYNYKNIKGNEAL